MKKGKEDWRWLLRFAAENLPAGLLFFISHLSLDQETERSPPALPDFELKGNPEMNKVVQNHDSGEQSRAPEVLSMMSEDSEHTAVSGHN